MEEADSYNIYLNEEKIGNTDETSFVLGYDNEETITLTISSSCGEQESSLSNDIVLNLIDDAIIENNISLEIHPIPADDKIFITSSDVIKQISIFNITGVMIYESEDNTEEIDISGFNNGIYFIKINTDKGNITKKVIKE